MLFRASQTSRCALLISGVALWGMLVHPGGAAAQATRTVQAAPLKCGAYLGSTFEGATVTKAELLPASDATPETCVIRAEMPQDLDFELRMPTHWNQRTMFVGGGGFDGAIHQWGANLWVPPADPMKGGYATIATNHGHNENVTPGASFALDVQMLAEYAYLSVPRVLAPAKTILRAYYGQGFDTGKIIYQGCSGGGRQALIQAQRFPDLFDGIISRAPANAYVPQFLWYAKIAKLHAAPGGALTSGKINAIGAAVRAKCDVLDGLKDGIISRPDSCEFDPAELACTAGETDTCLTPPQVATARGYYEPTNIANGRYTWPGFPAGGETPMSWLVVGNKYTNPLFDGFMRYMVAQDPNVDPLTVDPEKYIKRLDYLSAAIDAVDRDLSRFKAHGGKVILWTGQTDWLITANNATAYYQSVVEKAGGQAAADEFIEYYTSPDVQHCMTGAGPDTIDLTTAMFEWLEKGVKPSAKTIIATQSKVPEQTKPVSRPLCRFPRYPKYVGGDPNSATSFSCALPEGSSSESKSTS